MANDTEVQIKVTATTQDLQSGMRQASDSVRRLSDETKSQSESMGSSFKELGSLLVEAFAVDKIIKMTEAMAELGEQVERTATLTGMALNEVQQFQFAVEMTGGSAESAGQSLLRFENNLGKAQEGAGPAAAAYKALGINLFDLNGNAKSTTEVLGEIAEKFSETEDGARKVEFATALGSRGFTQLIPLLDKGKDGLAELNKKMAEFGGPLTTDQIENLGDLKRANVELGAAWTHLKEQGAADLAPMFATIDGWLVKLIKGFDDLDDSVKGASDSMERMVTGGPSHIVPSGYMSDADVAAKFSKAGKNQLPELDVAGAGKKAAQDQIDIERMKADTIRQISLIELQGKKDMLAQEVANHQLSKQQEIAQTYQYEKEEYNINYNALMDQLENDNLSIKEKQKIYDQIQILYAKHLQNMAKLDMQFAKQQQADLKEYTDLFKHATDQMLTGILQGTQTWQQALQRLFSNLVTSLISKQFNKLVDAWVAGEDAKTTATVVGNAERTASDQAATAASGLGFFEKIIKEITADAASVFGGVFSFLAPEMGPAAAIPAAASEAAVIAQVASVPSFAVGSWSVPATGLANIHQGEMIIPAAQAEAIRSGSSGGGGDTIHIHAVDAHSFKKMLQNNSATITGIIKTAKRNFSGNLQSLKG